MRYPALFCMVLGLFLLSLPQPSVFAQGLSFERSYQRGKLFLKKKLYADAVVELEKAVFQTGKGKKHFAAHYYLARAYYRVGQTAKALKMLKKSKPLIKNSDQKEPYELMLSQINTLFGKVQVVPEVDPDEVGLLKMVIRPKMPFSHPQKQRSFSIISKRWSEVGIPLNGKAVYLPKGEYTVRIGTPQCLSYGFVKSEALVQEISVDKKIVSLALQSKTSCKCEGGQIVKQESTKKVCACPTGSVWSKDEARCVIPGGAKEQSTWIGQNWPWVTAIGVGAVAAGIIVPVVLINRQNQDVNVSLTGEKNSLPQIFKKNELKK